MNNEKLISVVTICKNAEKTISNTISSILANKNSDLEYLIIDGNSTDNTISIIKKYEKHIDNWISEPDQGISDAFNKGIELSKGKYIIFLNSDDIWYSNAINEVTRACKVLDSDIICFSIKKKKENKLIYVKSKPERINKGMYIAHPATLIKKDVYNKIGYYNLAFKYAMDYELLLRAHKRGISFIAIDTPIVQMSGGGISDLNPLKGAMECYKAFCMYEKNLFKRVLFSNFILKRWLNRVLLRI